MRIGSIVFDCRDFQRVSTFWREALRYVPRDPPTEGWVDLRDPEKRASPGPIHLDRIEVGL